MPDRDLFAGVLQLGNLLTRRLAPVFARNGVTPQQWLVLSALATAGAPISLAALARSTLVSKQNMTGMVARLEHHGLAERVPDPDDLRSTRVSLTRRGRSVIDKLRPAYEQWLQSMTGQAVSARDLQNFSRTIDRMIEALNQVES